MLKIVRYNREFVITEFITYGVYCFCLFYNTNHRLLGRLAASFQPAGPPDR